MKIFKNLKMHIAMAINVILTINILFLVFKGIAFSMLVLVLFPIAVTLFYYLYYKEWLDALKAAIIPYKLIVACLASLIWLLSIVAIYTTFALVFTLDKKQAKEYLKGRGF